MGSSSSSSSVVIIYTDGSSPAKKVGGQEAYQHCLDDSETDACNASGFDWSTTQNYLFFQSTIYVKVDDPSDLKKIQSLVGQYSVPNGTEAVINAISQQVQAAVQQTFETPSPLTGPWADSKGDKGRYYMECLYNSGYFVASVLFMNPFPALSRSLVAKKMHEKEHVVRVHSNKPIKKFSIEF
jgi:hypothetical protein